MASDDKTCPDCHGWGVIRIVGGTQAQVPCALCGGSGRKQNAVPVTEMNLSGFNLTHSPALEGCRARCAELEAEASELRTAIQEWAEATDAEGAAHHDHGEGRITTAEYFEAFERFDAARSALRRLAGGEQ